MSAMPGIPRHWRTIGVPGVLERLYDMYWPIPLDVMPPVGRVLDGTLNWLLDTQTYDPSLRRGPDDPAERDADAAGLLAIAPAWSYPPTFRTFIEDPEARRHIRSATACYLDLAHFAVPVSDGGVLIHFLSDQQWVLHWLLYRYWIENELFFRLAVASRECPYTVRPGRRPPRPRGFDPRAG